MGGASDLPHPDGKIWEVSGAKLWSAQVDGHQVCEGDASLAPEERLQAAGSPCGKCSLPMGSPGR